jgi:hypothetical protein
VNISIMRYPLEYAFITRIIPSSDHKNITRLQFDWYKHLSSVTKSLARQAVIQSLNRSLRSCTIFDVPVVWDSSACAQHILRLRYTMSMLSLTLDMRIPLLCATYFRGFVGCSGAMFSLRPEQMSTVRK